MCRRCGKSDTDNEQFRIHSALQQPFEYPTDSSTESESETANYTKQAPTDFEYPTDSSTESEAGFLQLEDTPCDNAPLSLERTPADATAEGEYPTDSSTESETENKTDNPPLTVCPNQTPQLTPYCIPTATALSTGQCLQVFGKRPRKKYTSIKRRLGQKRICDKRKQRNLSPTVIANLCSSNTCTCGEHCYEHFTITKVTTERTKYFQLTQTEQKQYLLNTIRSSSEIRNGKIVPVYNFNRQPICRTAFEKLYPVAHATVTKIIKLLMNDIQKVSPRHTSIPNGETFVVQMFKAFVEQWKLGKGGYMPDSPCFHLCPGVKFKHLHQAFVEHLKNFPYIKRSGIDRSYVSRLRNLHFPEIIKRRFVRFTKCGVCCLLEDRITQANGQAEKGELKVTFCKALKYKDWLFLAKTMIGYFLQKGKLKIRMKIQGLVTPC